MNNTKGWNQKHVASYVHSIKLELMQVIVHVASYTDMSMTLQVTSHLV